MPQKRSLDIELSPPDDTIPRKEAKLELILDDTPSASTRVGDGSTAAASSDLSLSEAETPEPVCRKLSVDDERLPARDGLKCAVEAAMSIFKEAWVAHVISRDAAKGDEEDREDKASSDSELLVAEKYEEMKSILLDLLPWVGPMQPEGTHQVVEFRGRQPPRHVLRNKERLEEDRECLRTELEWLRGEPRGRAWEAMCAVAAALSSRKEKSWLEALEISSSLEEHLKKQSGCKTKKGEMRTAAIRSFIGEEMSSSGGCGFFAHYLVRSTTTMRVAFAPGLPTQLPTPAALVITARMPLWDAMRSLDGDCPFLGAAVDRDWCSKAGRQFAFQTANFGVDEESRKCRAAAETLQPDSKLRDLLRSRKPVVQLEIIAALAPRDVAKKQGLSEIVKAELAMVMLEAKRRGEAVVFCLGSDSPHVLAEKVYVRPPISDYGLRCGYLRWRASSSESWARERVWDDRTCLCLQMP